MNILDLRRQLLPVIGYRMPSESDGGNGTTGTSGATGAARGESRGQSGTSTSNYASRQGFDGATSYGATEKGDSIGESTGQYNKDITYGQLAALAKKDPNQDVPGNPNQTVSQALAAQKFHGFMNSTVPAVAAAVNPGFGIAMNAARAYASGDMTGFVGGILGQALGAATGIPGFSGIGQSVGKSVAKGETPNFSSIADGYLSGAIKRGVTQSTGNPLIGMAAGSLSRGLIK